MATALAWVDSKQNLFVAALCVIVALSLQIVSNFVNDAADFQRGADGKERLGPERMAASGRMTPRQLYMGALFLVVLSILAGSHLIWLGGWTFVGLSAAAILSAVAYTAGPFPLAYLGLGDLFVFFFFGLVAVAGCYYLQTGDLSLEAVLFATMVGLHTTAIMAVNNIRDFETDKKAKKMTFAVRLGQRGSKVYFVLLIMVPYLLLFLTSLLTNTEPLWLGFVVLPFSARLIFRFLSVGDPKRYNQILGLVGLHNLCFVTAVTIALVYLGRQHG